MTARSSPTRRPRTCLTCGARLEHKRTGRPAKYCSDRCRDKAYEGRNFSAFATTRIRQEAIRRNSQKNLEPSMACEGDSAGRGSVFTTPLELIGHSSFKFDSSSLDPTIVRVIVKTELPGLMNKKAGAKLPLIPEAIETTFQTLPHNADDSTCDLTLPVRGNEGER